MRAHTASGVGAVGVAVMGAYAVESDDVGWEGRSGSVGIGARRLRGREAEGATVTANAMAPDGRRRRLSRHSALPQTSSDGGPEGVLEGVRRSDKCPVW